MREALLRLKMDGLVHIQPQRGTYVFTLDPDEISDVTVYRQMIETEALALGHAARPCRAGARAARQPRSHADRAWSPDPRAVHALDTEFHWTIVRACGNRHVVEAYALVGHRIEALRYRLPAGNEDVTHCQENHRRIVSRDRPGRAAPLPGDAARAHPFH